MYFYLKNSFTLQIRHLLYESHVKHMTNVQQTICKTCRVAMLLNTGRPVNYLDSMVACSFVNAASLA